MLEIKTINGGKKLFYEKNYEKICINTNDDVPLNKKLKFLSLTIIIRRVLQINKELYPHIFLNECLYEYECKCECECECKWECEHECEWILIKILWILWMLWILLWILWILWMLWMSLWIL